MSCNVAHVNGSVGDVSEAEADEESLLSPSEMDCDYNPSHATLADTQCSHMLHWSLSLLLTLTLPTQSEYVLVG